MKGDRQFTRRRPSFQAPAFGGMLEEAEGINDSGNNVGYGILLSTRGSPRRATHGTPRRAFPADTLSVLLVKTH
jgi:hypothetical protein